MTTTQKTTAAEWMKILALLLTVAMAVFGVYWKGQQSVIARVQGLNDVMTESKYDRAALRDGQEMQQMRIDNLYDKIDAVDSKINKIAVKLGVDVN